MRVRSLMYHNVVDDRALAELARAGDRYTLGRSSFAAHLDAVARAVAGAAVRVVPRVEPLADAVPLVLTFDDGDTGNLWAAEQLEERGWHGQFFVVTDLIGRPGYLDADGIRELHARGHVIGTHTASHPARISALAVPAQREEWARSVAVLADIVGAPVTVGAVPGGYHSRDVARAAAAAGLEHLWTSEPTSRTHRVDGCLVLGRYTVKTNVPAATAAALAVGDRRATLAQAASWNVKKLGKRLGGPAYLAFRRRALGLRS